MSGFLQSLFESRATGGPIAHPRDPVLADWFGGGSNSAGVAVSPDSAMRTAGVYVCVRVLADTMGMLPCRLFRRLSDGSKERADGHLLDRVVARNPNAWQSASEFRSLVTTHAALRGVGYAKIALRGDGRRMLVPMHTDRTRVEQADDGTLVYEYRDAKGKREVLLQDEVLRIPYLTRDGVQPLSPIRQHAETVAQASLGKSFTNTFLKNGGRPSGIIKFAVPFSSNDQRKKFRESFHEQFTGSQRGMTPILEGADYTPISVSNDDAQLIDLLKMSLLDVCRIYRVPPHMAGDLERATWGNIEHQQIGFAVHTMGIWVTGWEQALSLCLLTEKEQETLFFEFNLAAMLRGDSAAQSASFLAGRQGGWLSIDDVRGMLNMNKLPDGKGTDYLQPLNYTPVGADKPAPPKPQDPTNGN